MKNNFGIKKYKMIEEEKIRNKRKEKITFIYLIIFIILTIYKFITPKIKEKEINFSQKSQLFVIAPCVYLFIISSVIQPNPSKLKSSFIISIYFLYKYYYRFIIKRGIIPLIFFIIINICFWVFHIYTIKQVKQLNVSEIKKRLAILNKRYNIIYSVESINNASLRLTLFSLAEQVFFINIDFISGYIIFNNGFNIFISINIFILIFKFYTLFISQRNESFILRFISISLYVLNPIYNFLEISFISKKSINVYTQESIISFIITTFLSFSVAIFGYLDIKNFGKGLSQL